MFLFVIITMMFVNQSVAVIYSINETEYHQMPALFAMDDYEECMLQRGGTYCVADYELFHRGQSHLMHFIQTRSYMGWAIFPFDQVYCEGDPRNLIRPLFGITAEWIICVSLDELDEYSANKIKHFNHTKIHRATCVTTTCKNFLNAENKTVDIKAVLEACLNGSLWKSHKLEASLLKVEYCKKVDDETNFDTSDFIVASVYVAIIIINIIGSLYDVILCKKDTKTGNSYLLAFSMRRNWAKLLAPSGMGPDPRMNRLKVFNGLRTMSIVCVICSHTTLFLLRTYIANPLFIEKAYDDLSTHIIYNGTLITSTFFVMSGFLLTYNLQIHSEKSKITWMHIPKGILLRWIRLTPPYALVVVTMGTIIRHAGGGPLWDLIVVSEANYCRQYWWAHVLYFNNYIYERDVCFPQGWYLAADTQLFCVGLIIMVLVQRPSYRKLVLILLFVASLAIVGGLTYFQDLDAVVLQSPENFRTHYLSNETFKQIYIRGHTNLSAYALGLAAGILVHRWQTNEKDFTKYKKYRWITWLVFPLGLAVILFGSIFYADGVTPSALLKVAYATLHKPIFQSLVLLIIISSIFKIESVYRGITEWSGWASTARLSYSAYLLHGLFLVALAGIQTTPMTFSKYFLLLMLFASIFASYLVGAMLWILVESPVTGLSRALLAPRPRNDS